MNLPALRGKIYHNIIKELLPIKINCKNKAGVYKFFQTGDPKKFYYGSTNDLYGRIKEHILASKKEKNNKFYNAVNNCSLKWADFSFEIMEISEKENITFQEMEYYRNIEQKLIDTENPPLNTCLFVGSTKGYKHSNITREKISEALTGKPHTEESKALRSERSKGENNSFFGKKHTEETRAIISAKSSKKVYLYDKENKLIIIFISISEAVKELKFSYETIKKYNNQNSIYLKIGYFTEIALDSQLPKFFSNTPEWQDFLKDNKIESRRKESRKLYLYSTTNELLFIFPSLNNIKQELNTDSKKFLKHNNKENLYKNKYYFTELPIDSQLPKYLSGTPEWKEFVSQF